MIAIARAAHPELSVRRLCTLLGVSRAWNYAHQREELATRQEETRLRDAIAWLVLAFPGYGYRRVTKALQRDGWAVNHKRVLRLMRQESLLCQLKLRFVATTDSCHGCRASPNLLREAAVDRLDRDRVADITCIRLPTAFAYLACLLDARHPAAGLIHHSDRGVQYASAAYVARLESVGARSSLARSAILTRTPRRSVSSRWRREEVSLEEYRTFEEARANLAQFIDGV